MIRICSAITVSMNLEVFSFIIGSVCLCARPVCMP